jgi:hypothetical protein
MPKINIKPAVRATPIAAVRFIVKFVNGAWAAFDTVNFGHGPSIGTQKEAIRIVGDLNEGKLRWAA